METKAIGYVIAEQRKAHGWTQKQLADLLGVTDKAVSKWECNKSLPDVALLASCLKYWKFLLMNYSAKEA